MKKFLLTLLGVSVIFAFIACNNANANKPEEVEESTSSTESTKVVNPNKGVYGLLTGIVVDSYTAAPVEGVTVTIEGTNYKTVTGADGAYYFNKVPVGTYKIGYSKDGFRAQVSDVVEVVATQFLDDDPFYKKTVIDALLTLAGNAQEWESAKLDNGTLGSSTITKDDANQTSEAVSNTTSGTGKTEKNTFDFEWFVENIDNYEYYYGISLTTAKLVKLGATVKGKLVGYIEHGNAENYETGATGTGYSQEITRGTTTPLANVTVYAKVVDSGNSSDAELDGDVWKTTSDSSGNFEFKNLPVGTIMKIGFTAFDKEIEGVKYSFLNSNVEYRDSEDVNATEATFVTLDATVYETVNNVEKVVVDNVLDISSIYVKGIAPSPYIVNTNGVAKGEANPNVGTGFSTPIAVTDSITVTFNMEMDPTEFVAFYSDGADQPVETTADGEQMIAEWSEDKKTVSLKRRMNQVFPYTSASDDTYAPVAYVYFNNATAKAHTASGFEVIAIHTIKGIALAKENAVTYIAADKVPSRDLALDELDTLPFLGAVKLTFTKNIDTTAANKFKAYIKTRLTGNFKEIELADSDIIYGKDADAKSVYIKVKGLEKASVAKVEYKVFSTDPEDSIDNLGAADDDAIIFRTSDALTLVSTNLYGDDNNIYYNSLSTGDFGTNVFKLTEDIKLTFKTDIPTGATIKAELYKKDDIAAESTIGGIKGYNIVTGTPTVAGKVITIKHEPLELNTEYVFGVKVINSDGFVCFNTKSSVWAQLFTVNKTIDESGNEVDSDGLISNVALTIDNAEAKDADSFYIWFKTAATAELKLKEVDAYDYPYAYQTTKESVEYKLLAGTEDIVLTFEDEPYGAIPADDDCYKVSIVAAKADDLDAKNLITSIAIDTDERTLTISHEDFDELSTYYLSLEVFADNTLTDENKIFTTVGGTFAGKEKAKLDGNFITIMTAEATWQLVKANVYNYGENNKYLGIDTVGSITGIETEAVFEADDVIELTFNKNINIADKNVKVVLFSEDNEPADKETLPGAKTIADDSVACTYTVAGSVLKITPASALEAGKEYWLYVAVTDKEDDDFNYFITDNDAADTYGIRDNVYFEGSDDIFIGFEVYEEPVPPNKVFVLSDTNLVSFDDDDNIYYAVNSTTASTAIDFGVSTPITLTFTEPLPTGAVVTAELYPVNVIGGYENNPVELLKRNVVTGNPTISGATVTVNHSALIPATDYAFAVKVTADGYDDFYTKALDTITCEPQLRDDDNSEYYLIANTQIDANADGSYYLVFNTADGFTAVVGDDYATNIALDGTTANFPATDEDILIEVNKDISSASNTITVYWGETKAVAEARTRETSLSGTVTSEKDGTTSVIKIDNTTSAVTLVPGYFYNVVIESDGEEINYIFKVATDFALGNAGTATKAATMTTAANDIDSTTAKIKVDIAPVTHNYNLAKEYKYYYAYKEGTSLDYDEATWTLAATADNLGYLAINTYGKTIKDVELSFAKGKETLTGFDLPWMAVADNKVTFIEQQVTDVGTLIYYTVGDISDGKMSAEVSTVTIPDTIPANTIYTWTVNSKNTTSTTFEPIKVVAAGLGQFYNNCDIEVSYNDNFSTATVKVKVISEITTTTAADGVQFTVYDVANNIDTVSKTKN